MGNCTSRDTEDKSNAKEKGTDKDNKKKPKKQKSDSQTKKTGRNKKKNTGKGEKYRADQSSAQATETTVHEDTKENRLSSEPVRSVSISGQSAPNSAVPFSDLKDNQYNPNTSAQTSTSTAPITTTQTRDKRPVSSAAVEVHKEANPANLSVSPIQKVDKPTMTSSKESRDIALSTTDIAKAAKEEKNGRLQAENISLSKKLSEVEQGCKELERKLNSACLEKKAWEDQALQLRDEKGKLLSNMSTMMNASMSRNESDLENINIRCRPMTVAEDFAFFCSNTWLDAKMALDDWAEEQDAEIPEQILCEFLVQAMFHCYAHAEKLFHANKNHVSSLLENPLLPCVISENTAVFAPAAKRDDNPSSSEKKELDVDMQVMVAKSLRVNRDKTKFDLVGQAVCEDFLRTNPRLGLSEDVYKQLLPYFTKGIALGWSMVLQRPTMTYACVPDIGAKYEEFKHELNYNSADPKNKNAVIHYFVHPAVFHGDKQMGKAKIVLHVPEPTKKGKSSKKSEKKKGSKPKDDKAAKRKSDGDTSSSTTVAPKALRVESSPAVGEEQCPGGLSRQNLTHNSVPELYRMNSKSYEAAL